MEILHFREFNSRLNNESLSVIKEATEVLDEYVLFSRDTLEGKYGLTARY